MTESGPKIQEKEGRSILYNALVETLDFIEKRRERFSKWQNARKRKKIKLNDYCALVDNIWTSGLTIEFKQGEIDKFNKKYDTSHTIESLS